MECVGIEESCPSGKFQPGQQMAALMVEMGQKFDGCQAEFTLVPEAILELKAGETQIEDRMGF